MNIKVKADKILFDRFKNLGGKIDDAGALVQNDMELPAYEILMKLVEVQKVILELNQLVEDTRGHILGRNH